MRSTAARPSSRSDAALPVGRDRIEWILARTPLQPLWRARSRRRIAALAYHSVTNPVSFKAHVEFLLRHANPVGLDDVILSIAGGSQIPPYSVLVTFDDGDRTVLDVAAPVLQMYGIRAVVFVVAGVIDTDRPYWWQEVVGLVRAGAALPGWPTNEDALIRHLKRCSDDERTDALAELRRAARGVRITVGSQLRRDDLVALERMGLEVANHTMSHPCIPRCSAHKVRSEIDDAGECLSSIVGHRPRAFAYPNGDWDPRAERLLADLGYRAAFLFDHQLADPRKAHPLRISRVRVDAGASIDRLRIITSGLHPAIHRLRGMD